MPSDQEIIHKLITEARNGAFEMAALICDGLSVRFGAEERMCSYLQARACRLAADEIRNRAKGE